MTREYNVGVRIAGVVEKSGLWGEAKAQRIESGRCKRVCVDEQTSKYAMHRLLWLFGARVGGGGLAHKLDGLPCSEAFIIL